mmetsp:Transcript_25344/g.75664  ORF Transcript_25344/g.75664 Transcript_25344/m.75664 type:complete len:807 (+) Transcript_25344:527-2947(+)
MRLGHLRGPVLHEAPSRLALLPPSRVLLLHGDALHPQLEGADVFRSEVHPVALHGNAGEDVLDPLTALIVADLDALAHPASRPEPPQVQLDLLQAVEDGRDDLGYVVLVEPHPRDPRGLVAALVLEVLQLEVVHLGEGLADLEQGDVLRHLDDLVQQLIVRNPLVAVVELPVDVLQMLEDGHAVPGVHPHLCVDIHDDGQDHVDNEHDDQHEVQEDPQERRPPLPGREGRPIVLALDGDLEAQAHGPKGVGKVDDAPSEDHHPREGEGRDREQADDEVVEEVGAARQERLRHNRKARLPLKGDDDLAQEQYVAEGNTRPEVLRDEAHHGLGCFDQVSLHCRRGVGIERLKSLRHVRLHAGHDTEEAKVDPREPHRQEAEGEGCVRKRPQLPGPCRFEDLHGHRNGAHQQQDHEDEVDYVAAEGQEEHERLALNLELRVDAPAAAEEEGHLGQYDAGDVGHLAVEDERLHLQHARLRVKPLALLQVLDPVVELSELLAAVELEHVLLAEVGGRHLGLDLLPHGYQPPPGGGAARGGEALVGAAQDGPRGRGGARVAVPPLPLALQGPGLPAQAGRRRRQRGEARSVGLAGERVHREALDVLGQVPAGRLHLAPLQLHPDGAQEVAVLADGAPLLPGHGVTQAVVLLEEEGQVRVLHEGPDVVDRHDVAHLLLEVCLHRQVRDVREGKILVGHRGEHVEDEEQHRDRQHDAASPPLVVLLYHLPQDFPLHHGGAGRQRRLPQHHPRPLHRQAEILLLDLGVAGVEHVARLAHRVVRAVADDAVLALGDVHAQQVLELRNENRSIGGRG